MKIAKILALFGTMFVFSSNAYAVGGIADMFANGQASFEALINLVKFSAYIIGVFMIVGSIFKFSQLGKGGGQPMSPKVPIVMFFCGVGIFSLISAVSIATATMAMGTGPGDILATAGSGSLSGFSSSAMKGVLTFMRLIGYIAFIRGFVLLNQSAQPNAQSGTIFRGITHIFGGVAAINITVFGKILANTFAPGMNVPFL